jgi:hypothetical protein
MLLKELQQLGFSKNIAVTYLALAELGGRAKAGQVIKKTNLHRNLVYGCLDRLIEKQLVTRVEERGVAIYKLLDTKRLMNEVRQKEQLVAQITEEMKAFIKHPQTQEVIIHEGLEGFRDYSFSVLEKLKKGDTLRVIGSNGDTWCELMGPDNYERYKEIQLKKQVRWQMISSTYSELENKFNREHRDLCQVKLIPQISNNPANINIFGDTVALQIFTEPYSVIEIKNLSLTEVYINHFNYLWGQEVQTYRGLKEIEGILRENLLAGFTHDVFGAGYGYGSKEQIEQVTKFYLDFSRKTSYLKPKRQLIFFEQFKSAAEYEISQQDTTTRKNTEIRFLPSQYYTPMQTHVFTHKVVLIFWFGEPIATVYTNPEIVAAYKKEFSLLWDTAKSSG